VITRESVYARERVGMSVWKVCVKMCVCSNFPEYRRNKIVSMTRSLGGMCMFML